MAGLQPIVDELVWRLATDEMTAKTMMQIDYDNLKENLLLYLCAKTSGPCLDVGARPLIRFDGSPSGVAKRMLELIEASARARGFDATLTGELVEALEQEVRAMIGPRAAGGR